MLKRCFTWFRRPFLIAMGIGAGIIAHASTVYFNDEELPDFVIEKLPLPNEDLWFLALRIHVIVAVLTLPACLALLSRRLLRGLPRLHRWLGRTTGTVVLLGLVPSGLYLSWYAKGGMVSTVGFALTGIIVAFAMVRAIAAARARNYTQHARYTRHVVAQLSVAVISRAMMTALDAVNVDPMLAYVVSLWLPVVGTAALVEWHHFSSKPKTQHKTENRSPHVAHAIPDDFHADLGRLHGSTGH